MYVGHCSTLSGLRRMRSEMPAGTQRAYPGTQKRRKNESQRSFILYESLNAATLDKEQSPRFHWVNDKSQFDFIWAGISCPACKGKNHTKHRKKAAETTAAVHGSRLHLFWGQREPTCVRQERWLVYFYFFFSQIVASLVFWGLGLAFWGD